MIAKFTEQIGSNSLEVDIKEDGVSFYIYDEEDEQSGRHVIIPINEIDNLIKYLQSNK